LTNINAVSSAYTGCTQESLSVTALSNNQLSATGYSYDASGNMLTDGRNTYTWNSEDQLKTAAGVTYTYDGGGHRVEKSNGKLYWYGTGSDPLMETDLSGNLTDEYIFFGGKRIARRDSSNNVVYYAADHLGTSRVVASFSGAILDQSDFYPFGGERIITASSGNTYKFTSKERDTESNLDNFGARYDSSILGRFMSPDVGPFHLDNPQSLNRYTYTLDNPLIYVDPDGADTVSAVYQLGTVSVKSFVASGQTLDPASMLASVSGGFDHLPLADLKSGQPMATPRELDTGGGCVFGCASGFNEVPSSISISLSFSYDDKSGQVTGANIQFSIDSGGAFIGPNPRAQRSAFQPLPGMAPGPEVFSVNISGSVLQKLTPAQLQALSNATIGGRDAISQAIQNAVLAEEQRRAAAQRKKEEDEQKAKPLK
jgi:RHS repeat-associated protein